MLEVDRVVATKTAEQDTLTEEVQALTTELRQTEVEGRMLHDAVGPRTIPGISKNAGQIEKEIRDEYEKKYRSSIIGQINQEKPLIQWTTDNSSGVLNRDQAEDQRIRLLYERARLRDTAPPITPQATDLDNRIFENIARGTAPMPRKGTAQLERKLS